MSQQYPHDPNQPYQHNPNQPFRPYPPPQQAPQQAPPAPQPPAPRKKPVSRSAKIGWAALSGLVLFALGAAAGNAGAGRQSTASTAAGLPVPTATVTVPGEAVGVTAPPTTVTVTAPPPKPAAKPTADSSPKPTAAPKTSSKTTFKKLTARQWAKIAKSPDDHIGESYVVYGRVTQFDAATGEDAFRADVDGVKHKVSYGFVDYPTNTVLTNLSADVSDVVEDDLFQANVQILGSLSYDTQIGGETTVPNLSVISLKVTGSVK
ncbi:hypothetical protein ACIA58_34615 [Kribbella sp. NPDC051586]|uniref:hypothetical protein n=1 Tax=Kribbella sp. NPDC051586 TaxID=3364118 RepID=UPI003792AFC0